MTRAVSIDGELVPPERAVISVFDRGFLYGDAVFETLRVYRGHPFARSEHLARLERSCAALRIALPVPVEVLAREIAQVVAAFGTVDAYLRVTITRGPSERTSLLPGNEPRASRIIAIEPLTLPPKATYVDGLRAITLPWTRAGEGSPASEAKLPTYVTSLLAIEEARSRGAHDAIFVSHDGRVRDASTANVFLVDDDGRLVTPSEGKGVLGGITRGHVLDIGCALGFSVAVAPLGVDELLRAREVFLTSSLREIASVVAIDGKPVGAGVPGEIARSLHRAYRLRCGADGPPPWE